MNRPNSSASPELAAVSVRIIDLSDLASSKTCRGWSNLIALSDENSRGKVQNVLAISTAVRLLVAHFGNEVCVRGNCDQAPFSLASMMRSPQAWMMDLIDPANERCAVDLLEYCTTATVQFLRLDGRDWSTRDL